MALSNDVAARATSPEEVDAATSINTRLERIVELILGNKKFIHAADESGGNISGQFVKLGIDNTPENRAAYRVAMFSAPEYEGRVGGVILFDETIRQQHEDKFIRDILKDKGIVLGVKVDSGLIQYNGSVIEQIGKNELDRLPERLAQYREFGASFAKFRVVANIGSEGDQSCPSQQCLVENARLLGEYAKLCQQAGIVPIVEPEVTMKGSHTIEQCRDATSRFVSTTFAALHDFGVHLPGIILKTNMVIPGSEGPSATVEECAYATVNMLNDHVPPIIGGVVFLSGGQESNVAFQRLRRIIELAAVEYNFRYPISSSFSRALQGDALLAFAGKAADGKQDFKGAKESFSRALLANERAVRLL